MFCSRLCRHREYVRRNPERVKEVRIKWRAENYEHFRAKMREWGKSPKGRESQRNMNLKQKYGLTLSERNALAARQDEKCDICGEQVDLEVDHCHASRIVRGLLCQRCNKVLGWLKDDSALALEMHHYLDAWNSVRDIILETEAA